MKQIYFILVALLLCSGTTAQNKHIVFDNKGIIEKNNNVKVDTLLLINGEKGVVSDTVFIISFEDKQSFFVSKQGKANYSFFPYMNMQVKKKEESTNIIVLERTGFIILSGVFLLLFCLLWWKNQKYMQTVNAVFSEMESYKNQFSALSKDIKKIEVSKLEEKAFLHEIRDVIDSHLNIEKVDLSRIKEANEKILKHLQLLNHDNIAALLGLDDADIEKLSTPVTDYPFSTRPLNCFNEVDVKTIFDLLCLISKRNRKSLLILRNLGKKGVFEIENILIENGFINQPKNSYDWTEIYSSKYDDYIKEVK